MTLSVLIISGVSNLERNIRVLEKTSKQMFNCYIAPLTLSLKGAVEGRQRKPGSSDLSQCSANISCLLHKTAFKEFRYEES